MSTDKTRKNYFRQVVIALNSTRLRTKKEKKWEMLRALPVLAGVFLPIIVIPLCAGLRKLFVGFAIVLVAEIVCVVVGVQLARNNVSGFYRVPDAHEKVTVASLPNDCQISDCCNVFYLLGSTEDDVLDFIYNWAYGAGLLRNAGLNLYILDDTDAKQFFGVSDGVTVLGCRTDEMRITDATLAECNRLDFTLTQVNSGFVNGRAPAEQYFAPEENVTTVKSKFAANMQGILLFSHPNAEMKMDRAEEEKSNRRETELPNSG